MELSEATQILESLASGFDPANGQALPPNGPHNSPDSVRALYTVLRTLEANAATLGGAAVPAPRDVWEGFSNITVRYAGTEERTIDMREGFTELGGIGEDTAEFNTMVRKYSPNGRPNLQDDVPNLYLQLGTYRHRMTWNEAYNLGRALCDLARVSLHG